VNITSSGVLFNSGLGKLAHSPQSSELLYSMELHPATRELAIVWTQPQKPTPQSEVT
jgi:hypothetical protein